MRFASSPRPRDLQPRLSQSVAAALGRYRRGGRRERVIRRGVAGVLLLVAGWLALVDGPTGPAGTDVAVAARDLESGAALHTADIRVVRVAEPPDGALRRADVPNGQLIAGRVRRGEILTDARLVDIRGAPPGPGRVAVPVRPNDAGTVALLQIGMHVAVIGTTREGSAETVSDDAVVLWIPPAPAAGPSGAGPAGRLVVLGIPAGAADRTAALALTGSIGLRFA